MTKLVAGGEIPPGHLVIVGEHGPEMVVPGDFHIDPEALKQWREAVLREEKDDE